MTQPFNNFVDNLELGDLRQMMQQGRSLEALPRLYKLAAAYPDNQEVRALVAQAMGLSPQSSPPPIQQQFQQPITYPSQIQEPLYGSSSSISSTNGKPLGLLGNKRLILIPIAAAVVVLAIAAIIIAFVSKPKPEDYHQYADDRTLIQQAYVGEKVRFHGFTLIGPVFNSVAKGLGSTTPIAVPKTENDEPNLIRLDLDNNDSVTIDFSHYGNGHKPESGSFTVLGKVTRRESNHIYVDVDGLIFDDNSMGTETTK